MTRLLRRMQQEDGFTLIELLIVIIILGILAAIVLFGVATFRSDAQQACNDANARTVSAAHAAYAARNGSAASGTQALIDAGYISELPSCS